MTTQEMFNQSEEHPAIGIEEYARLGSMVQSFIPKERNEIQMSLRLESVKLAYTVFKDLNSFTASSWQSLSETQQREAFEEIFVIADLVYEYIMGNKVELPE